MVEPSLLENRNHKSAREAAAREYIERADRHQNLYLAASGTLMQFNAIMAAIHCAVLSMNFGKLKFVSAVSLLLHVLASLTLCWAARPIESSPHDKSSEVLSHYQLSRT